jgi:hypothetical protein
MSANKIGDREIDGSYAEIAEATVCTMRKEGTPQ